MTISLRDNAANPEIVISSTKNNLIEGSLISTLTTGTDNYIYSFGGGAALTTAQYCVVIGTNALANNTIQSSNIAIGHDALFSLNDAGAGNSQYNVAIGDLCLSGVTTGCIRNMAIGYGALSNGTGTISDNVAIGFQALLNSSSTTKTVAIGSQTGSSFNDNGGIFIGWQAGQNVGSGSNSAYIGASTGYQLAGSCPNNTMVGTNSVINLVSASGCTIIGSTCGTTPTSAATNLTLIGYSSNASDALSNAMALGYNTTVTVSNAANIGNGCFVGLNNSAPAYNLDVGTISNVSAMKVADSSSTPATPSSGSVYYSVSGIPSYITNMSAATRALPHRTSISNTNTTYTFALTDADTFQVCNNASAQTFTVPTNASVAFPIDTEIDLFQQGAGQVVIAAAGGVTIQSMFSNLKVGAQYSGATLKKLSTNTWSLVGNLTA